MKKIEVLPYTNISIRVRARRGPKQLNRTRLIKSSTLGVIGLAGCQSQGIHFPWGRGSSFVGAVRAYTLHRNDIFVVLRLSTFAAWSPTTHEQCSPFAHYPPAMHSKRVAAYSKWRRWQHPDHWAPTTPNSARLPPIILPQCIPKA